MTTDKLYLSEYQPKSELRVREHFVIKPRFPVIDIHSHFGPLLLGEDYLSKYDTENIVESLKEYGIRNIVNLELNWGSELDKMMEKTNTKENFILTFASLDITRIEDNDFDNYVKKLMQEHKNKGVKGIKLWKNISLSLKTKNGLHIRIDDERLKTVWECSAKLDMPILVHIADPIAFFRPVDRYNEQYDCLVDVPEWSFCKPDLYTFNELMDMQENMLRKNPDTTFIIAHVGSCAEDLGYVSSCLDRFPNMYVDIAARLNELGRQPYTSRSFFIKYQDRILFGSDFVPDDPINTYPYYFRFLETFDEYFDYCNTPVPVLGRWKIYGIGLDDDVLRKIYYANAKKLLKI